MYLAQVIARQGNTYIVEDEHGAQYHCHARSAAIDSVCGDRVECDTKSQTDHVIEKILPRRNQITRIDNFRREKTIAANIDHIVIVIAPVPAFTTTLIDKYCTYGFINQCKITLVINKAELASKQHIEIDNIETIYKTLVDNFIVSSARLGYGIQGLRNVIANENTILVGQSGVGKSSLINALLHNHRIKVAKLSKNIQQGKHTTTNAFAYPVSLGGKIIDSPGVRNFTPDFTSITDVMYGFIEFIPYLSQCKFSNCRHMNEPDCAIKNQLEKGNIHLSRYQSYLEITHGMRS